MTISSASEHHPLNDDADLPELFPRGFQDSGDGGADSDDLLSQWRADASDSGASDLYDQLLEPRAHEEGSEGLDSLGTPWEKDEESALHGLGKAPPSSPVRQLWLPGINDTIYGFKLLYELGSGSFAKVFLAKQGDLADREVVLKISAIEGTEPQTLAQLQHTHVVPIYSVHEDAQVGLRAVCMPYFGGASLARVLKEVWRSSAIPVSGRTLIEALDIVAGPEPAVRAAHSDDDADSESLDAEHVQTAHTARITLAGLPYVQAVVWIVARLAEGLQHSHERHVIHRDIKPSNILLSSEGQPLLLDFNVSQVFDCDPTEATVGGTVAYMSPEQLRLMRDRTAANNAQVNHRSDIYSLGLVLYEMLTGASPFGGTIVGTAGPRPLDAPIRQREQPVPSLKERCPMEIPWGLESIVRTSLATDPADRYASAAQLAEDLNRFLQDLPLKFAPELSRVEQVRKWGRRHPRLLTACTVMLVAAMLIVPGGFLLHLTRGDLEHKTHQLTDAKAKDQSFRFQNEARLALCRIKTVTSNDDTSLDVDTLRSGIVATKGALAMYQVMTEVDWQADIHWQRLEPQDRITNAETIRELLLELASTQVRLDRNNSARSGMIALSLLEAAERIRGLRPSRALMLDRARYLSLLNRHTAAERALVAADQIPVTSAHDMYMLAAAHARNRSGAGYREAVKLLTTAIELSPNHYWSHFERALCHHELGESLLAISDLGTCIGLWPQSSWAHFNRGYLLYEQGHNREAVEEYSAAIRFSPELRSAYFNRALARLELRDFTAALVDIKKVEALGRNDAIVMASRAMALEGTGYHAEADRLFAQVLELAKNSHDATTQRLSWTYAFAVAHRAPQISHQVFDEILRLNPQHAEALYGKGMLLMQERKLPAAVRLFDDSLNASTTFIQPLRYRAVALARMGQFPQAVADANACVEREPTNPDSLYIAACVASLSFRKLGVHELKVNALKLLQRAIEYGAERDRARNDPDFSALRGDPDFIELLGPESEPPDQPQAASL